MRKEFNNNRIVLIQFFRNELMAVNWLVGLGMKADNQRRNALSLQYSVRIQLQFNCVIPSRSSFCPISLLTILSVTFVACCFMDTIFDGRALEFGRKQYRFRLCLDLFAAVASAYQSTTDELNASTRLIAVQD